MRRPSLPLYSLTLFFVVAGLGFGQGHVPQQRDQASANEDPATVARGRALFQSTCGFCHGEDATGSRAPDLVRSPLVNHDDHGNLLGPVIRNGRPDKGMPSFSTMSDAQIAAIVAFLHHQAFTALHSSHVPGDYPLAKLLTGNAEAGKEFFNGAGECSKCHSPTGDLADIAKKLKPIELQQAMVYPGNGKTERTAIVTVKDGQKFEGKVVHEDEFNIGIICQDGWYRSWPRDEVQVEIHDPLEAHRELTSKYTEADLHNLFAYLETLK
ncbi:MAG TPA: c-type cytochrome [Bryobacteraceae bacterium]|nr:c-type cytochrome [Bryobacteraceae bacterium]